MKHNFLKKLTALLLGTIMVFSMIPAIAIGTKAAETTVTVSIADYASTNNWEDATKYLEIAMDNKITVTASGGSNTGRYYTSGSDWRIYQTEGPSVTISGDGVTIKTVTITYKSNKNGCLTFNSVNIASGTTVEVNSSSITFGVGNTGTATNGQARITDIEVVYETASVVCDEHVDTDPVNCECDNCGASIDHEWIDGEVITEGDCTTDRVVSQICDNCGESGEDKVITAPGHTYTDGICSECGAEKPAVPTFKKVTSNIDDFSGTYLIVYEATKLAFNGSLTSLDAGKNGVDIVIDGGVTTGDKDYSAYVFYIEEVEGGYAIKSASGYYIGQTSYANGLKTDAAAQYLNTISIDENGNAVITAVIDADNKPTLRYNNNAGDTNLRFRYYKTGSGQDIALYKLVEEVTEPDEPEEPVVEAPVFESFGVTLNKGVTIRVKYNISSEWLVANPGAQVEFNNGDKFDALENSNYYYTTLTPGQIGSNLTVTLGGVETVVSFAKYAEEINKIDDYTKLNGLNDAEDLEALKTFVNAIVTYGEAAGGAAAGTPDFTGVKTPVKTDDDNIGVFGDNLTLDAILGDYANIGITINNAEGLSYTISLAGKVVASGENLATIVKDGKLTIENLRPVNFNDDIVLTVTNGEGKTATATFTFNAYLSALYSQANEYQNIAAATYNYGVAIEAYIAELAQ